MQNTYDNYEQFHVADKHPEVVKTAVCLYMNWLDEMLKSSPTSVDPMWNVISEGGPFHAKGHPKKYIERLQHTGRADKAKQLIQNYPGEMV